MHVCHLTQTSVQGAYFENLTKGLVQKGVQVTLIDLGDYREPTWLTGLEGTQYLSLSKSSKSQIPFAARALAKILNRTGIDLLQTHLYDAGLVGAICKKIRPKTIFALTRHHSGVVHLLGGRVHVALDRWMARQADHIVVPSNGTRQYLIEEDHIKKHIDVVYYGFDFGKLSGSDDERDRVRKEFGIEPEELVIGYIGNFASGKGHIQLVRAFAEIVGDRPAARLLLVGRGQLAEVDDAIEEHGLRDKVAMAGWRDDVAACLSAMDIFVQPSLSEAFSQVLIEAMAVGLPVIATKVGGAGEVIDDGENGFLIEPNDTAAIADRAIRLIDDQALRASFASKGSGHVRSKFGVEQMVDRQLELYYKWLGKDGNS